MRRRIWVVATGCALALVASSSQAVPVTWQFVGTVDSAANAPLGVSVGQEVSVTITFEPGTPDGAPADPSRGFYSGALISASIQVAAAGFSESWPPFQGGAAPNLIDVNLFNTGAGQIGIVASNSVQGALAIFLQVDPLSSDVLPTAPQAFDTANAGNVIQWNANTTQSSFAAHLASVTLVPEPAVSTLVGAGLVVCFARSRLRVRSNRT